MPEKTLRLDVAGLGIILYSPGAVEHIASGEDYFTSHYTQPEQVAKHIHEGSIVGFCTGSPGTYYLSIRDGYPTQRVNEDFGMGIRLAIRVACGQVIFRDLYDLMSWDPQVPVEQRMALKDGNYHLTVLTKLPVSGITGDNQQIAIYINEIQEFPKLTWTSVPMLGD